MNKAQIIASLKAARLFRGLPDNEIESLAGAAAVIRYETNAIIIFRGDPAEQVYLVLDGSVAVETMSSHGKTIAINSLSAGEVFGEMAVLDGRDRSANIRALEPTTILLISKTRFLALIRTNPDFADEVIQDLVRRLRQADDQIEAIIFLPLRRRLADLLLELFRRHGPVLKITQADLAHRLTATREKVNVNLQVLKNQGAIELGRAKIKLIDESLLSRPN